MADKGTGQGVGHVEKAISHPDEPQVDPPEDENDVDDDDDDDDDDDNGGGDEDDDLGLTSLGHEIKHMDPHPDLIAVRVIRAFRSVKIRQNKWRPVPHNLTGDNIEVDACIASGTYGIVFRAENRDTRTNDKPLGTRYAVKLSRYPVIEGGEMGSDHSPTLTESSEAHIKDMDEAVARSLNTKRSNEMKTSLRYIKEGHPNVCMMDGYAEFDILDHHYLMYIVEYCDLGTLWNLSSNFVEKGEYIPEGFMWHAFEQLLNGLTFCHGEHPDYRKSVGSRPKNESSIILRDMKPNNVFLQTSPASGTYPLLKLADFGEAIHLPIGGTRAHEYGNAVCDPPDNKMSAKYDVWSVGVMIYFLATNGQFPNKGLEAMIKEGPHWGRADKQQRNEMIEARSNPDRFIPICDHLTEGLYEQLRWVCNLNRHERPTAREAWTRTKAMSEPRVKLMYRPLPDWVDIRIRRPFRPLELADVDFRMQQAEDEGFVYEYAGRAVPSRFERDRSRVVWALEREKQMIREKKEERLRRFREKARDGERVSRQNALREVIENEEIRKIREEKERNGGWLEQRGKKRRRLGRVEAAEVSAGGA